MGFYFLYILLLILIPLSLGAALALGLGELYTKVYAQAPEKENEPEVTSTEEDMDMFLDDEDDVSATAEETSPTVTSETNISTTEEPDIENMAKEEGIPEPSAKEEKAENSLENAATEEVTTDSESQKKSVFDDKGLLPKTFKVDNVIEEMLEENDTETPDDLSSRIEEEYGELENQFEELEDKDDDAFFDNGDDSVARTTETTNGTDFDENTEKIDFSNEENAVSTISSTAKEILGEDFDFDSLASEYDEATASGEMEESAPDLDNQIEEESIDAETRRPEQEDGFFDGEDDPVARAMEYAGIADQKPAVEAATPVIMENSPIASPIHELGNGIYQAETLPINGDSELLNMLPDQQEIISVFPQELIHDTLIEPDRSEAARENSFMEESRPMFVRKKSILKPDEFSE